VSAHDLELSLSPLNQLEWAHEETDKVEDELLETKQTLDLLGLGIGGIDRALDAISMTRVRIHAARNILLDLTPEARDKQCA